ncbi:MAG: DNA-binding protein WhiA [Coriobacteriia bacterium]|nr:DNA-binding protein WhiA [Coriobacteriia bacterium]
MSFTAEVRDELSRIEPKRECCARAALSALIRFDGALTMSAGNTYRLELVTESAPVARTIISLAHSVGGLKTELISRRSVLHKTNNYLITIPSQARLEPALRALGLFESAYLSGGVDRALVRRDCCAISYLRGAFLGSGFVSDPRADAHFEITCQSEVLACDLTTLMQRFTIEAKSLERRGAWIVYLKGTEPILNFLALVGAHKAIFKTHDVRIVKEMRNDVNRRVNAEIANQAKASQAALSQLDAIYRLKQAGALEALPEGLREFAQLRLDNPDLSLRELGAAAVPPLSKSAVNHRMRRLEQVAASL